MAKAQPKTTLPEGFVTLRPARSAGYYVTRKGNSVRGYFREMVETDDPFNKGAKRVFFKVELTADETVIVDSETKTERVAEIGEVIGIDEKGFLKALRDVEKCREIYFVCTGQQEKKDVKKGRSPAWLFELGAVPF